MEDIKTSETTPVKDFPNAPEMSANAQALI